jgi:hypothetical protein
MTPLHRSGMTTTIFISVAALIAGAGTSAAAGETRVTCVNPASGAHWQIRIDYDRRTVNSNSASISGSEISWRDASDGGNYTLDRKSGDLTMVAASSTGGYFLHHHCELAKSGR